jgi:hypothetical protein
MRSKFSVVNSENADFWFYDLETFLDAQIFSLNPIMKIVVF